MNLTQAIKLLISSTQQIGEQMKAFEGNADQAPVVGIARALMDIQSATTSLIELEGTLQGAVSAEGKPDAHS